MQVEREKKIIDKLNKAHIVSPQILSHRLSKNMLENMWEGTPQNLC